jgi:hypothetical protein
MNDEYGAFGKNLDRGMNNTNTQGGMFLQGLNPLQNQFNQGADMFSKAGLGQAGLFQQGGGNGLINTLISTAGNLAKTGSGTGSGS